MSTNYYWYEKPPCDKCGHQPEPKHIGKSNGGWTFSLHVYPDESIYNYEDWLVLWKKAGSFIKNEYGEITAIEAMINIISHRSWPEHNKKSEQWYTENYAVRGPNGLARFKIDGKHCIGYGSGTWDLIIGEFC